MHTFRTSVNSSEIICHAWATKPTLLIRKQVAEFENLNDSVASDSIIIANESIEASQDTVSLAESGQFWPRAVSGGYNLENASPHLDVTLSDPTESDDAAVVSVDALPNPFGTFHFAGNKNRGRKIELIKDKNFFAQDPFERFSAHKIRARPATNNSTGNIPQLKDRIAESFETYTNAIPKQIPKSRKNSRNKNEVPETSPDAEPEVYNVSLGQFHGVTVPGGGKRRTVVAPKMPKSQNEIEKDLFRSAYNLLSDVFEDTRDNITVETLKDAMAHNTPFKAKLLNTIIFPTIKKRNWKMLDKKFGHHKDGIISFEDFYDFTRDLYVEEKVPVSRVRFPMRGAHRVEDRSLKRPIQEFEVDEKVEARIRDGPTWLTGVVLSANENGTYDIRYDAISVINSTNKSSLGGKSESTFRSKKLKRLKKTATTKTIHMSKNDGWRDLSKKQIMIMGERQLAEFSFDITVARLQAMKSEEENLETIVVSDKQNGGAEASVAKESILEILRSVLQGGGEEGERDDDHLGEIVRMSSSIVSIFKLKDIKAAFDAVLEVGGVGGGGGEEREGGGEGKGEDDGYGDETFEADMISKSTFVEFCLGVSELLRFNEIVFS